METVIKSYEQTKSGFKVVQDGKIIKSYNRMGQEFHFMDLSYLSDGIILHGWVGFRSGEQIKEVLDGHFFDIYSKSPCKKMLINNSQMTGSFSMVNDWLANIFMPKMIDLGLKDNAVVLPANVFASLAVEDWDQKVGGFTTKNFKSLDEGLAWLKKQ
ncbi:MAG: hypothetical protein QM786_04660 [Breznakibacter sp.]